MAAVPTVAPAFATEVRPPTTRGRLLSPSEATPSPSPEEDVLGSEGPEGACGLGLETGALGLAGAAFTNGLVVFGFTRLGSFIAIYTISAGFIFSRPHIQEMTDLLSQNLSVSHTSKGALVPNVPRVIPVDPVSVVSQYVWGQDVEFKLPRTLGKVKDAVIAITVGNLTGTNYAPPTSFWHDRLTQTVGSSAVLETVYKEDHFNEAITFLNQQDFAAIAPKIWMNNDGTFKASTALTAGTYYLPLWACLFMTAQPYVKGFNNEWKIKITLPSSQPALSGSTGTWYITGLRLLVTEAKLPAGIEASLAARHLSGITYQTVARVRHYDQKTIVAGNNEYQLTPFSKTDSAALLFYIRAQDSDTTNVGKRYQVNTINFRDADQNLFFATDLDGDFVEAFILPYQVQTSAGMAFTAPAINNYLIPFCSKLQTVIEDGTVDSAYRLEGTEKIVLNLTSSQVAALPSGATFVCVSYNYTKLKVKNGLVMPVPGRA